MSDIGTDRDVLVWFMQTNCCQTMFDWPTNAELFIKAASDINDLASDPIATAFQMKALVRVFDATLGPKAAPVFFSKKKDWKWICPVPEWIKGGKYGRRDALWIDSAGNILSCETRKDGLLDFIVTEQGPGVNHAS